jgi:hypothetical protein
MKRILSAIVMSIVTAAVAVTQMPNAAQAGGKGFNQIGPSVTFGGGESVFGINGKLGIADNLSLRPFVTFPASATTFGSSLTYDWDLGNRAPLTPFVGAGLAIASVGGTTQTDGFAELGADFNLNRDFALSGIVDIPFNSNNASTTFTLGANFRF